MSILRKTQQWGTFARIWHIWDATWQDPFQSAPLICKYLMGRHKPIYHPMADCGDHVVIINSKEIALRGNEWYKRVYFHDTCYFGGKTWTLAWELHKKDPKMVMTKAIYSELPKNLQRRHTMQRCHIYEDDKVPDHIMANVGSQLRQLRPVPQRLDLIPDEVVQQFPRIFTLPDNYTAKDAYTNTDSNETSPELKQS